MDNKILNKWIFGAALLLLAACTQDELTEQAGTLPEGIYPLEVSSATLRAEASSQPWGAGGPQTRVSENPDRNSSKWDGGEVITVQLGDNETTTTYEVQTDGSLELTGDRLYWAKRNDKVMAWYPANGTIDLSNQSERLAYVLQANETANFDQPVTLNFEHKLAKIRVKLTGEKAGDVNDVKIESYTSCTNTSGMVTTDGASIGEITMYKVDDNTYEANVVPDVDITRFKVNGGEWVNLSKTVTPVAGNYHEITINAENKYILIENVSEYTVTKNKPVIIRGNVTVNFEDYNVNTSYNGATIKIESGSPTLIFKGTDNKIECGEAPILLAPDAGVTIKGSTGNAEDSQLIVRSGNRYPGIGSGFSENDSNIPKTCGNITIENITLYANGSFGGGNKVSAAIGTPGGYAGSCGDITITNSIVHAQGGPGAAAIGIGGNIYRDISCGKITINNSEIYATVEYFRFTAGYEGYGAGIGIGDLLNGVTATVGEISINTKESEADFFSSNRFRDTNGNSTGFYKVGKSTYTSLGTQVWSGVKFNGKSLASGSDNGYPKNL